MYLKCLVTVGALALSVSAPAQHGPYAGEQQRAIKSLSEKDIADLQAGQGMGLAKAAELNGYPGPAHVLEHADALRAPAAVEPAQDVLLQKTGPQLPKPGRAHSGH